MKSLSLVAAALCVLGTAGTVTAESDCPVEIKNQNEVTARIVFEQVLGQGRIDENEHIYHSDFVAHGLTRDASRAEDREASLGWRQAFPDLSMTVLRTVVSCDMVTVHFEGVGTNTGTGNGLPATGKRVQAQGMTIFHFQNGQILEEWTVFDQYSMLMQLGMLGTR